MTRMTIALAVSSLLVAGSALAQTAPPPTQTPPPATQAVKPPATLPQATPTPAPKPVTPPEPFPPGAMVAYIDLQRVVAESKLGKQGRDAMQSLNDKLGADLMAKNKELVALQDRIKQQQNIVSDPVLQGMGRDLEKLQRTATFLQQDAQVQSDQLQAQLLQGFQEKVLPIVETIRKEKGLLIIFAIGENSNIAAAHVGLDLSAELVKRLDAITK